MVCVAKEAQPHTNFDSDSVTALCFLGPATLCNACGLRYAKEVLTKLPPDAQIE